MMRLTLLQTLKRSLQILPIMTGDIGTSLSNVFHHKRPVLCKNKSKYTELTTESTDITFTSVATIIVNDKSPRSLMVSNTF